MNEEARASGLKHTHFENPVGFDAKGALQQCARLGQDGPPGNAGSRVQEDSLDGVRDHLHPVQGDTAGQYQRVAILLWAGHGDESYVCVALDAGEDRFAASVGPCDTVSPPTTAKAL